MFTVGKWPERQPFVIHFAPYPADVRDLQGETADKGAIEKKGRLGMTQRNCMFHASGDANV